MKKGRDELRAVEQHEQDPLLAAHPEAAQARSRAADKPLQLPVGD
jgi:hypothetical protein